MRAFILAGGAALRAGGMNKSFLEVEGRPILEHQLVRLRPLFAERISVVTDRLRDYEPYSLDCIQDLMLPRMAVERASLLGLASALSANPSGWSFVLAADMPWPDELVLRGLWRSILHSLDDVGLQGACLGGPSGVEPFHAIYHGGLGPSAIAALSEEPSIRRWIAGSPSILVVEASDLGLPAEAVERCLANFNYGR